MAFISVLISSSFVIDVSEYNPSFHSRSKLLLLPVFRSIHRFSSFFMAHRLDDDYIYDVDNLTDLLASSQILEGDPSGARPKKSKRLNQKSTKSSAKATAPAKTDAIQESTLTSSLELEKLRHQNLQLQLEITKTELELAKIKTQPPPEPTNLSMAAIQPRSLEKALSSTPANGVPPLDILTLSQLREKKKPGHSLPNNYVFSSKGTLTYESLEIPDFIYGFLEFYKEQPAPCQQALLKHLQLLMERAATYSWPSIRNFHLANASAIEQGRLTWTQSEAIRERSQTFFSHQDLRTQLRPSPTQRQPPSPQSPAQRAARSTKDHYCREWNYTGKCSCAITSVSYASSHRCRVCDTSEHPMLHCPKRRFPVPSIAAPVANPDPNKD